jgi:hypothetical protein
VGFNTLESLRVAIFVGAKGLFLAELRSSWGKRLYFLLYFRFRSNPAIERKYLNGRNTPKRTFSEPC